MDWCQSTCLDLRFRYGVHSVSIISWWMAYRHPKPPKLTTNLCRSKSLFLFFPSTFRFIFPECPQFHCELEVSWKLQFHNWKNQWWFFEAGIWSWLPKKLLFLAMWFPPAACAEWRQLLQPRQGRLELRPGVTSQSTRGYDLQQDGTSWRFRGATSHLKNMVWQNLEEEKLTIYL